MKARMRRLAKAAIAEAMQRESAYRPDAARCVVGARDEAANAVVNLIWDWFEVRERRR